MSLIDEALKRAREQTGGAAAPPPDAASRPLPRSDPWEYAPLPQRRSGRLRRVAIAAVAGALALAGGAFYMGSRARGRGIAAAPASARPPAVATGSSSSPAPVPGADTWRSPVEVAPPPRRPVLEIPPGGAASAPVAEASPRGHTQAQAQAQAQGASPPSRTILGSEAARAGSRAPRASVGFLVAPNGGRVELGGIVFSETNPVALVNGRVLPVGGIVEGLTVVAIEENRIELAGDGLRAYLSLK